MDTTTMTVLTTDFYNEFACVAADCRNSCCVHPWKVYINKQNYKRLRALREPKWLVNDFGKHIKRNSNNKGDGDYAVAVYNEHGCGFQTETGLCRLQADLGASYLSDTCKNYPRQETYLLEPAATALHKERSVVISCEEVARMLLHKPEPIQLVLTTEDNVMSRAEIRRLTSPNVLIHNGTRPMLDHYALVRAICIAVLQNRDYTIEQRLMLLAVYLDKLATAEEASNTDSVPAMTDTFVLAVDERLYDKLFAATPIPEVTAVLSSYATAYTFAGRQGSKDSIRCGAGITTVDYTQLMGNYHSYVADKQAFLEHLLVNELFCKVLPFSQGRSIRECMQYIVSIYTIFRFALGGYLGEQATLTEVELIDFVAYFGKSVLHTPNSFDSNIELLKRNNMDTLAHIIAIIIG